jgi:hypothetical protein
MVGGYFTSSAELDKKAAPTMLQVPELKMAPPCENFQSHVQHRGREMGSKSRNLPRPDDRSIMPTVRFIPGYPQPAIIFDFHIGRVIQSKRNFDFHLQY